MREKVLKQRSPVSIATSKRPVCPFLRGTARVRNDQFMLTHFISASSATGALSPHGLLRILARWRSNNPAASVTGMLLHVENSFCQAA